MNRTKWGIVGIVVALLATMISGVASAGQAVLPASSWYAVAWNRSVDTLHWINANGEQASIARPNLPDEANPANARVTVSPNGRKLVITADLNNGREGFGIFDLASGTFVKTHVADAFETFLNPGRYAFTESSTHVVAALRNTETGDWRLVVFELNTGNAVDQLTRTDPNTPDNFITDPTWQPNIVAFNVDEGSGGTEVRFQIWLTTSDSMLTFPSFKWTPATNGVVAAQPVKPDAFPYSPRAGFDIQPMTGTIVLAWYDDAQGPAENANSANSIRVQQSAAQLPMPVVTQYSANTRQPVWLKNGEWIGYRNNNGVVQPHRVIMTANGQNALPLGPNIAFVYHTPDGFLALDDTQWKLMHQTDLNLDAYAASFGNTVFAPGSAFNVIYTTPAATAFTLASIADAPLVVANDFAPQPTNTPVTIGGAGDILAQPTSTPVIVIVGDKVAPPATATQPPLVVAPPATATPPQVVLAPQPLCNLAPESRLNVGNKAHVIDLGGTLALRTNLSDPIPSHQLPARQVVEIIEGPACRDGYRMWRVSTTLNGSAVTGWVSEGTQQQYFLRRGLLRLNS